MEFYSMDDSSKTGCLSDLAKMEPDEVPEKMKPKEDPSRFLEAVNESLFSAVKDNDTFALSSVSGASAVSIASADAANASTVSSMHTQPLLPLFLYITTVGDTDDHTFQELLVSWDILRQFQVKKIKNTRNAEQKHTAESVYEIRCLTTESKRVWGELIYKLNEHNQVDKPKIKYTLDYSHFISHPGVIFIKNLSHELVGATSSNLTITGEESSGNILFAYLLQNCLFKSLTEIKIFTGDSARSLNVTTPPTPSSQANSSTFAIVRFDNYIDADIIISKMNKLVPNIFNQDPQVPLYLNKYLNKRERSLSANTVILPSPPHMANSPGLSPVSPDLSLSTPNQPGGKAYFDIIFIENLIRFFPHDFNSSQISTTLTKISEFGCEIDSIYFPVSRGGTSKHSSKKEMRSLDYGYIKFKPNSKTVENTLNVLYYLNNITWLQLEKLDVRNLQPLFEEPIVEDVRQQDGLCLTIAQYKHNQYLYSNSNSDFFSYKSDGVYLSGPNLELVTHTFTRTVNYQETNIYVNNLPIIFNNDDALWESFWRQFGIIKSAKIIKPQYYRPSESNESNNKKTQQNQNQSSSAKPSSGKIGFVFYNDFKMAIKAILLTNSKVVYLPKSENYHSHPILIQSSFALQKSNARTGNHYKSSSGGSQYFHSTPADHRHTQSSQGNHKSQNYSSSQPNYANSMGRYHQPPIKQSILPYSAGMNAQLNSDRPTASLHPQNPHSPYFNPYYLYSAPGGTTVTPQVYFPHPVVGATSASANSGEINAQLGRTTTHANGSGYNHSYGRAANGSGAPAHFRNPRRHQSYPENQADYEVANYHFGNVNYPPFPYNLSATYYYDYNYEDGYRSN